MSNILDNILSQKLAEIQSGLPSYVRLTRVHNTSIQSNFSEMLESELTSVKYDGQYDDLINEAARKYNLNSNLIKAMIKAESNFNPKAVSKAGAMGLMQLMPETAETLGVDNPFDPGQNICGGARYLKDMLIEFDGNIEYALAAYNAGPGSVKKYGGIPPFEETQDYVKKIMNWLKNKA